MKKVTMALVLVATLVVALLTTGQVYAQGTTPTNPTTPGAGYANGGGQIDGRGIRSGNAYAATGDGLLHDSMIAEYAAELGISVDDLNARLASGETLAQIAVEKGLTVEEFRALMADTSSQAIDQAVKEGTLTQAQADWMKARGARSATATRGMGMRGANASAQDCPYFPQTAQ